jgi:hypothetical protein
MMDREGRPRPSLFASRLAIVAAVSAVLLGACVRQPKPASDAGPPKDLGERAVFETTTTTIAPDGSAPPPSSGAAPTTTAASSAATTAGRGATTTTTARGGTSGGTSVTSTPSKPLGGTVTDRSGDNGLESPDYADVVSVALEDTGRELRATITFTSGVPRTLAQGEVMGVGVDLFRTNERESDYQLFATGRADGWTAYLDTPDGFVKYPGSFTISGTTLVFSVPWTSVGGHAPATFSTFADWSKAAVAVIAQTGQDSAPDQGTAPLA